MSQPVPMPALGESVSEGTVTQWLKKVGEHVAVDEPLVEISTDKVDTEIPSPFEGVLLEILVAEDEVAEVGSILGVLGQPGEATASGASGAPVADAVQAAPAAPPVSAAPVAPVADAVQAAPAAPPVPAAPVAPVADAFQAPLSSPTAPVPTPLGGPALASQTASAAPAATIASSAASSASGSAADAVPGPVAAPSPAAGPTPYAVPAGGVGGAAAPSGRAAGSPGTASSTGYVTPIIRKLAAELGVDLAKVSGTGIGGRIRREDVVAAVPPPPAPTPPEPETVAAPAGAAARLPRLRAMTAERHLHEVFQPTQLTSVAEVDATELTRLVERGRRRFLEREGIELAPDPFFALATVEALKANPVFNAAIVDGDVRYFGQENLGVTVFTPSGPLVPVIPDAGALGLVGLARAIAGVQARAAGGALGPSDLAAGTFTITAPAGPDLMLDFPIISPPQVAVLSVGAVTRRPVVVGEGIAVRSTSYLALSYDSRLITPSDAAKFLSAVKARLEKGGFEAELGL